MNFEFDPYRVLGVSLGAQPEDIKKAYRNLARRLHPDTNQNNPGASIQFKDVTTAYELLIDPDRRRAYDDQTRRRKTDDEMYFTLRVTPIARRLTALPEPQVTYLLAELFPDPRATETETKRESRLNLTLVLDHSNSMAGTRLEKLKIAAHQLVDQMSQTDILSVVIFNDRAEVIIPATYVKDKPALKAKISMMVAAGGTEIYHGLSKGVEQNRTYLGPRLVNHVILLTDGHTFGDQERCLELAQTAAKEGISISALGLGHDWNDQFLDSIASKTGGTSEFINSPSGIVRFLNDHVKNLANGFAERVRLSVATDPDVQLELAFRIAPNPQPLEQENGYIALGSLQANRSIAVLLQFQLPGEMQPGYRSVARLLAVGDVLQNRNQTMQEVSDIELQVSSEANHDEPPSVILEALSKLTLYRLQERAQEAVEAGDVHEATRRLENLATRLLALGQEELAGQALSEARRVAHTRDLSDKGRKTLKYQTRHLLLSSSTGDSSE
ncbi:MAG: DnaJ domain-containing protein [bacterium]|nr:DnaJ domain-containing protein [bacterium]